MNKNSPWVLLRAGKAEQKEGLLQARQAFAKEPSASYSMQLGVALLWLEQYAEAYDHFRSRIETAPRVGDNDYGMAGAAKWCLGKPDEAVSEWRVGLNAKYARAAGLNIRMPLLLFFASVVKPEVFERASAEELMLKMTGDIRIKGWPGPIASWLLAQITEEEFQVHCKGWDEKDALDCEWLAEFYRAVARYDPNKTGEFKKSMRKLTDVSQSEWLDQNYFTSRVWSEEFFLARHETKG